MESFCSKRKRTNVGKFDCDLARLFPNKIVLGGYAFTDAECADDTTFHDALVAATKLDSGNADKLFCINTILDPNDTTEANKTGAVGEGVVQTLVEGRPAFTYRVEIGQDLYKRLRKFNKQRIPVFTYDDGGNMWGAASSAGRFVGCEAVFFISGNTQQTASTPVSALIEIRYVSANQYHEDAYYVPVELTEFEPAGLLDAYLKEVSHSSNVYKIGLDVPTAQKDAFINLAKKYNAQLVAGLFNARTGATYGTTLAITSVAYDSTLEKLTITFDSTAFGLLASLAKIKLYLDPVADLETAGITGIEGVELIITKP